MNIRALTEKDAEVYYNLRIEALRNDPDAFATRLEDALKKPVQKTAEQLSSQDAVTFGAFSSERLIGNVTLARNVLPKMIHRGSVLAVYVSPEARGQGVASRLMGELVSFAENRKGMEQLHLMVVSDNEPAKKLYRNLGFEKYGTEIRSMKTGDKYIDEDLMVKFMKQEQGSI